MMNDEQDTSKHSEGPTGRKEPAPSGEDGPEKMSRRDALRTGAYAAPAILAIGSVPSFASGGSPCPGHSGDAPHNSGGECPGNSGGNGNGNGTHGNGKGHKKGHGRGGGNHGNGDYGNSDYGRSDYGTGFGGDSYGGND